MRNSRNLHWTLTVWGSASIEIQTTGSCPQNLWGCKNTARCELKRHPLRLASFNLALLLIILMISASAKSSIPAPKRQCRLLNSITSLTECMQTQNTATGLYPRRGGFEPRGNANANSTMIKFYLKSQVSTRKNNIASEDICTTPHLVNISVMKQTQHQLGNTNLVSLWSLEYKTHTRTLNSFFSRQAVVAYPNSQ